MQSQLKLKCRISGCANDVDVAGHHLVFCPLHVQAARNALEWSLMTGLEPPNLNPTPKTPAHSPTLFVFRDASPRRKSVTTLARPKKINSTKLPPKPAIAKAKTIVKKPKSPTPPKPVVAKVKKATVPKKETKPAVKAIPKSKKQIGTEDKPIIKKEKKVVKFKGMLPVKPEA